jgi:hypothetical protein
VTCDRFALEGALALERGEPLDPHYATCPDCAAALAAYRAIAADVGALAAGAAPAPDWQARVHAGIARAQPRRRLAWLWALPVAAAAALAIALLRPGPPPSLTVDVVAGGGQARAETPKAGDRLAIRAVVGGPAELRVYRDDAEMVLRCADAAPCARDGRTLSADWALPGPGRYRALLIVGPAPAPAGGLDADVRAVREAGGSPLLSQEIAVW